MDDTQGSPLETAIAITSARDVKLHRELHSTTTIRAALQGIITRVDPRGGLVFLKLFDGTDTIQLMAERSRFSDADWKSIRSIKRGSRVFVDAPVALSAKGIVSLVLQTAPVSTPELHTELLPNGITEGGRVATQIFLARLRTGASQFFTKQGFVELEPNFISTSWESTGLEPLKVDYPGFGGPAYLVPSPSPQLIRALIVAGKDRIFSISRCFTTSYRDAASSYQSVLLNAKQIGASLDNLLDLSVSAVRAILSDLSTRPSGPDFLSGRWSSVELSWPPMPGSLRVTSPQIQRFRMVTADGLLNGRCIQLFRICWPPDFVLAEGAAELLGEDVLLGSLTVHIERMLLLIRSETSIRRLWHEGPKATHESL